MNAIPAEHTGMASGFLITGHEVGAALGVAVLSAIAGTAGNLTAPTGTADAFTRGGLAAAASRPCSPPWPPFGCRPARPTRLTCTCTELLARRNH